MIKIFKTVQYSDYLGEERPILDIITDFESGPPPSPSVTPTITPTMSVTPSNTPSLTPTPTPSSTPPIGYSLAVDFLDKVQSVGGTGITDNVTASTVTFFTSLINEGIYSKLRLLYLFLGGTKNSCQVQAIKTIPSQLPYPNPIVLTNMGISSSGITGNGSSSYGRVDGTGINGPSTFGVFIGNDTDGNYCDVSALTNTPFASDYGYSLYVRDSDTFTGNTFSFAQGGATVSNTDSLGFFISNYTGSTRTYWKNSTQIVSKNEGVERIANLEPHLGVRIVDDYVSGEVYSDYSNRLYQLFFWTFEDSPLTDTEIQTFSDIVNTYQSNLGRYSY